MSATGGGTPEVILADAGNAQTMPAHFIAGEDLAIDAEGRGILSGEIRGIDTATPGFVEGDVIYVAVGGGYANVAPAGEANLIQNLGVVTRVDASNGAGEVYGAGRAAATPNLDDGKIFIGDATNKAVTANFNNTVDAHLTGGDGKHTPQALLQLTAQWLEQLVHKQLVVLRHLLQMLYWLMAQLFQIQMLQ